MHERTKKQETSQLPKKMEDRSVNWIHRKGNSNDLMKEWKEVQPHCKSDQLITLHPSERHKSEMWVVCRMCWWGCGERDCRCVSGVQSGCEWNMWTPWTCACQKKKQEMEEEKEVGKVWKRKEQRNKKSDYWSG